MSTLTNAQLAAKTADEIEKRGWVQGDLTNFAGVDPALIYSDFDPAVAVHEDDWLEDIFTMSEAAYQHCKVCLLGGTGAAFYGDPRRGADGDKNGYDTFIHALAYKIDPDWISQHKTDAFETVYNWNDGLPAETGKEQVIKLLTEATAEWSAAETPAQQAAEAVA